MFHHGQLVQIKAPICVLLEIIANSQLEMDDSSASAVWMSRLETLPLSRGDMNTLVMDYLVTEGYKDAAQVFMLVKILFKVLSVSKLCAKRNLW